MRNRSQSPSTPRSPGSVSPPAACSPEHPASSCLRRWSTNIVYGVENISLPMRVRTRAIAALGEGTGAAVNCVEKLWGRRGRVTLMALALLLATLISSGCGMFRGSLAMVGMRNATPVSTPPHSSPVAAAYANESRTRVVVKYTLKEDRDCWVHLSARKVRKELARAREFAREQKERVPYPPHIPGLAVRRWSAWRPRWNVRKMQRLKVLEASTLESTINRDLLRVSIDPRYTPRYPMVDVRVLMDHEGSGKPRPVQFTIAHYQYRTGWGKVAQVGQPVAFVLDVATCPIQLFIIMWKFGG